MMTKIRTKMIKNLTKEEMETICKKHKMCADCELYLKENKVVLE